jgi:FtsH Extracellular/Domain of unknown function (DUF4145)
MKAMRNFALWVIIVLLLLALFTVFQNPGQRSVSQDISFSQLLTDVDQGKVRDVVIQGPEIHGTYTDGRGFNTYAPNDSTLVQRFYGKGVAIAARPQQENVPWLVLLLFSWLPFIVLIGALVFSLSTIARAIRRLEEAVEFYPRTIDTLPTPKDVPADLQSEFKQAELCASARAWRAGSAFLRSTLEKALRASGYEKGALAERIEQAASDGVITAARSRRAHDDIRVLGNDVLHDESREVTEDEFDHAHRYTQRILEDFYDDRSSVEAILISKGRLKVASAPDEKGAP